MELATNIVWAIVAVASYALLFRSLARQETEKVRGRSLSTCFIALTCALLIVFPIISLSDDLQEAQITAEEAAPSGQIIKRCVASHSLYRSQTSHHVWLIFAPSDQKPHWTVSAMLTVQQNHGTLPSLHPPAFGRAPPSLAATQNA
jgi:hypothetical protein